MALYKKPQISTNIKYQERKSHNSASSMTNKEAIRYINSGHYIPSSIKEKLKHQIDACYHTNSFSALDEFFAIIRPKDNEQTTENEKTVEFPSLGDATVKSNNVDYSVIMHNEPVKKEINIFSLIKDNVLSLKFNDIKEMYRVFAPYRIKLQYLTLTRKINTIDKLKNINLEKGTRFEKIYQYQNMVEDKETLSKCIDICIELSHIQYLFDESGLGLVMKLCQEVIDNNKNNFNQPNIWNAIDEAVNAFKKNNKIANMFVDQYQIFQNDIKRMFSYAIDVLNKIKLADEKIFDQIKDNVSKINQKINQIIDEIVDMNDPHQLCNYHVTLTNSEHDCIQIDGLSSWIYISCNDDIDLDADIDLLDDEILNHISVNDLSNYFNQNIVPDNEYFIKLYLSNHAQNIVPIYYDIDETVANHDKTQVKISGLPDGSKIISSYIVKHPVSVFNYYPLPMLKRKTGWLHKKNNLRLSVNEYKTINPNIQEKYPVEDTDKNIFAVDYLFDRLLESEHNHQQVTTDMYQSFIDFAFNKS